MQHQAPVWWSPAACLPYQAVDCRGQDCFLLSMSPVPTVRPGLGKALRESLFRVTVMTQPPRVCVIFLFPKASSHQGHFERHSHLEG